MGINVSLSLNGCSRGLYTFHSKIHSLHYSPRPAHCLEGIRRDRPHLSKDVFQWRTTQPHKWKLCRRSPTHCEDQSSQSNVPFTWRQSPLGTQCPLRVLLPGHPLPSEGLECAVPDHVVAAIWTQVSYIISRNGQR